MKQTTLSRFAIELNRKEFGFLPHKIYFNMESSLGVLMVIQELVKGKVTELSIAETLAEEEMKRFVDGLPVTVRNDHLNGVVDGDITIRPRRLSFDEEEGEYIQ